MAQRRRGSSFWLALLLAACVILLAMRSSMFQARGPQGMVADPCPPARAEPPGRAETIGAAVLSRLRGDGARRLLRDFGELCRYRRDNERLAAAGTRSQVVLMGDSITQLWGETDPGWFGDRVVNRGLAGQSSAQMLLRFRQDVVALRPRVVHIMAGLNDVAGHPGPMRAEDYRNNIRAMVDIARANGIAVVLGSITPVRRGSEGALGRPHATVAALNRWLRGYAAERDLAFADYDPVLLGPGGNPKPGYDSDGIHLTRPAYAAMRPVAEAAIAAALEAPAQNP